MPLGKELRVYLNKSMDLNRCAAHNLGVQIALGRKRRV
jgi:hypothetical protein